MSSRRAALAPAPGSEGPPCVGVLVVAVVTDGSESATFGVMEGAVLMEVAGIPAVATVVAVGAVAEGKKTDARSSNRFRGKKGSSGAEMGISKGRLTSAVWERPAKYARFCSVVNWDPPTLAWELAVELLSCVSIISIAFLFSICSVLSGEGSTGRHCPQNHSDSFTLIKSFSIGGS